MASQPPKNGVAVGVAVGVDVGTLVGAGVVVDMGVDVEFMLNERGTHAPVTNVSAFGWLSGAIGTIGFWVATNMVIPARVIVDTTTIAVTTLFLNIFFIFYLYPSTVFIQNRRFNYKVIYT